MDLTAKKRLREVFSFWSKAARSYSNGEEFVININACIQALRNVTFSLQSQKKDIVDFDSWYGPWQEAMARDSIMLWCRDARNKIVKESDLVTKSIAVASLHNNYVLEPTFVLDVSPVDSLGSIGKSIKNRISENQMGNGYLRIERRWVDADLDGVELLSALAHAFTVLATLVADIKERKGPGKIYPEYETDQKVINTEIVYSLLNEYTPECMKTFEDFRTEWFSFPGLRPVQSRYISTRISSKSKEEAKIRYDTSILPNKLPDSFEERYQYYINTAKHLLEVDGYHMTVIFLLDQKNKVKMINTEFPSQAEKYLFSQKLAKEVERHGIKEVYFISEAWTYSFEDKLKYESAELIDDKNEVLEISALSATGDFRNATIPFHHENGQSILGEMKEDNKLLNFFLPIAKVWAKSNKNIVRKILEVEAEVIPNKRFNLELYEPLMNEPCLCGSGQKYKKCCAGKYSSEGMNKAVQCINSKQYNDALINCRLHLTWYLLCYKAHTVPLGKRGTNNLAGQFIDMDIDALSDILRKLMLCYEKTRKGKQFLKTLDTLRSAIADEKWYNKIHYYKSLWHVRNTDLEKAYNELKNISDLNTTDELEILTLYLHVHSHKMCVDKRIEVVNRIIASRPAADIILQFQSYKAMQLYNHQDANAAIDVLKSAIDDFKKDGFEDSLSQCIFILGECFYHLGLFSKDTSYFKEGIKVCSEVLTNNDIDDFDLTQAHFTMGNLKLAVGNGGEAKDHFEKAFRLQPAEIIKVFIAKSCIKINEFLEAESLLLGVDESKFDDGERLDYAFAISTLAIETKEEDLLRKALVALSDTITDGRVNLDIKIAHLNQVRDLLALQETVSNIPN